MYDVQRTQQRFADWLKTDDFKSRYCETVFPRSRFGPAIAKWFLIIGVIGSFGATYFSKILKSTHPELAERVLSISLVSAFVLLGGIIIGLMVARDVVKRGLGIRKMRREIQKCEPVLGAIVILNSYVLSGKTKQGAGLIAIKVGPWEKGGATALQTFSSFACNLYSSPPENVPPQFRGLSAALKYDTHQDGRWRGVPKEFTDGTQFLLCDVMVWAAFLGPRILSEFVLCAVPPDHRGNVYHLPEGLVVWTNSESGAEVPRYSPDDLAADDTEARPTHYTDEIRQHIERSAGRSALVIQDSEPKFVHIDILIIPADEGREWHLLVTSGMSSKPMNVPPAAAHLVLGELAIRLPKHWEIDSSNPQQQKGHVDWAVRWLKGLARFPHALQTSLIETQTFQNSTPPEPLGKDVPFTGWLLVNSASGGTNIQPLKCNDGQTIYFHSLLPIHTSEMEFKVAKGAAMLQEKLIASGATDLLDIDRKPAV